MSMVMFFNMDTRSPIVSKFLSFSLSKDSGSLRLILLCPRECPLGDGILLISSSSSSSSSSSFTRTPPPPPPPPLVVVSRCCWNFFGGIIDFLGD